MSSNRGHRAGQCAPEVPRTRIRARGDLLEQCPRQQQTSFGGEVLRFGWQSGAPGPDEAAVWPGEAAGWQMMLQVEQGGQQLTSESCVHTQLRTDASSGVGNSTEKTPG